MLPASSTAVFARFFLALAGAFLLLAPAAARAEVDAERRKPRPKPVFVYEGTVRNSAINGWAVWISVQGKEVYGITRGESSDLEDLGRGWLWLKGTVGRRNSVSIKVFMPVFPDLDQPVLVGTITGSVSRSRLTGTVRLSGLEGGGRGSVSASVRPRDTRRSSRLIGNYDASPDSPLTQVKLMRGWKFLATGQIEEQERGRATGVWHVDSRGFLWVTPLVIQENNPLFRLIVKMRAPLKFKVEQDGRDLVLIDPVTDEVFTILERR